MALSASQSCIRCNGFKANTGSYCWKCIKIENTARVAGTYLTPGTRVGSPTAGVAGGPKKFIKTIMVETTSDPIVTTALGDPTTVITGPTHLNIRDQDGEHVPESLYERIKQVLYGPGATEDWQDRVQMVLDDWNRDGRFWMEQEINERYSADGSERYPQMVMWK